MGQLDISQATASNMENNVDEYEVSPKSTDGISSQDETTWTNSNWAQQWGYFNTLPDLKAAITMKSIWVCGKGYKCDPETQVILDHISGWGKDTFDDIIYNMEIVKRVSGDAYAEIIRDADTGILINLKPLDPASMRIVVDQKGIIKRYEQISKLPPKEVLHKFKPEEILHLSNDRLADQIHGISIIDSIEQILLANGESFSDIKKIMHRQAKPMIMFKVGTDNQARIDAFIAKMDAACNKGENIYIPDDVNSVSYEVIQVNVSNMVLEWRNEIRNLFYRAVGVPLVIFGQAGTTESGGKIEYLAHEQVFEKDQRYLEKQIWNQLNLRINLLPPTSLLENLQADENKDANQGLEIQPQDLTAGKG